MVEKKPIALAEALGGALGSILTTLLFYPIDVAKTRLQAKKPKLETKLEIKSHLKSQTNNKSSNEEENEESTSFSSTKSSKKMDIMTFDEKKLKNNIFSELMLLLSSRDIKGIYRGLRMKLYLSILSNFIYFYAYTLLKRWYMKKYNQRKIKFLANLILASIAGVVNVSLCMPLDVVTTKLQVLSPVKENRQLNEDNHEKKKVSRQSIDSSMSVQKIKVIDLNPKTNYINNPDVALDQNSELHLKNVSQVLRQGNPFIPHQQNDDATKLKDDLFMKSLNKYPSQSSNISIQGKICNIINTLRPYWQGIFPALILTCNPALNYAIFDSIKPLLLNSQNKKASKNALFLNTTMRIFLTGLIAKAIATLVTYPLIRIKVIMMAMSKSNESKKIRKDLVLIDQRKHDNVYSVKKNKILKEDHNEDADDNSYSSGGSEFFDPNPINVYDKNDDEDGEMDCNGQDEKNNSYQNRLEENDKNAYQDSGQQQSTTTPLSSFENLEDQEKQSICEIMTEIWKVDGIKGYYIGLDAQLLIVVFKSALLLLTKERISRLSAAIIRSFYLSSKKTS